MTYLRNILKFMEEPLCTYQYFDLFKKISVNLSKTLNFEEIIDQIKNLIHLQDPLYIETWKFLTKILHELQLTKVYSKKYLAQAFADIIFKAPEYWSSDLSTWR